MSSTKVPLNQHRKKKYVSKEREAPFPVPIASITREVPSKNYWYHYTGQIQGDHVLVTHTGDISYLNRMGYFGRGMMSRGAPAVNKELPYVHLPSARSEEPDIVHVMRRRMYLKHMKWKKANDIRLSNKESAEDIDSKYGDPEDEEFDSDVEYFHPEHVPGNDMKSNIDQSGPGNHLNTASVNLNIPNNSSTINGFDISEQQSNTVVLGNNSANQNSSLWSWNEDLSNHKVTDDLWENTTSNQNAATDAWDKMEADEDFWASEDVPDDKNKNIPKENSPHRGENVYTNSDMCSIQTKSEKRDQDDCDSSQSPQVKRIKLSGESGNTSNTDKTDHMNSQSLQQSQTCTEDGSKREHEVNQGNSVSNEMQVVAKPNVSSGEDGNDIVERTAVDVHKEEKSEGSVQIEDHIEKDNEKLTSGDCDNVEKLGESRNDQGKMGTDKPESLPVHPYCRDGDDDEEEGDVDGKTAVAGDEYLVIDDSDIDDSTERGHRKEKYTWIPVRKKEVFNFNEPLVLSYEEAYFLCYGLGCLTVQDENQTDLPLTELWCRFCRKQEFLPRYVAYHFFRSKGWVPKPSLLFGTDFLVYKVGPEVYHASYSVIVKTVYEGTFEEVEGYNKRKLTWTSLFGLNRVTEHVAKTLVYCYVIMPRDLSDEERQSPECISKFKVRLQSVQRWVSSQEREKEKIIDDIT